MLQKQSATIVDRRTKNPEETTQVRGMNPMRVHLKIKNKSLASEARTIKTEEERLRKILMYKRMKNGPDKITTDDKGNITAIVGGWDEATISLHKTIMSLSQHRRLPVRKERRSSHLAYNFLKGTAYKKAEGFCYTEPNWSDIERMALRYGDDDERVIRQKFEEWRTT